MAKRGRKIAYDRERETSGRVSRQLPPSLAQAARLAGMNPMLGTPAGVACSMGQISRDEYQQALRVEETVMAYRRALQIKGVASPSPNASAQAAPVDPDTDEGQAEARRHRSAVVRYDAMSDALRLRGPAIADATIKFSIGETCTWQEREWAKVGLAQLVDNLRGGNRRRG